MEQETQSGDRVEHNASEMERFFTYQEIWYKQYVRPAIKEDVKDQFEKCAAPIVQRVEDLNKRLLIKSFAFILMIAILFLMSLS